jgi:hypothetical protein
MKSRFLVCYDYGMGGLWGVVHAQSKGEVLRRYPELVIVDERPEWMTEERFRQLESNAYDVEAAPRGMLEAVVAERDKN